MLEHEYSLLSGFNRAKVGRYISLASATLSAGIVFVLLWAVDLAKRFEIPANVPPAILSLAGAGTVFIVLYWFFDKYAWKWSYVSKLLKVPNLSGKWSCEGQSLDLNGNLVFPWKGEVIIVQSWDKIRVRLSTGQSGSNSNSAAIICDEADGYRLFYSYKNDPRISETELHSHRGFAELTFDAEVKTAEGEYFNGHGRYTFGRMKLKRQ